MNAALLAIGDELILGQSVDTNSAWIAGQLAARSIETAEQRTVGDDRNAMVLAINQLAEEYDVLILTGGLGPTDDDLTREALGDVVSPGQPLIQDEHALKELQERFLKRDMDMPKGNRKQALHPKTMKLLPNPRGTAPGLTGEYRGCLIFALPGPPYEMQHMFEHHVLPAFPIVDDVVVLLSGTIHALGMGESDAAARLDDLMQREQNPRVGITVSDSIVTARVLSRGTQAIAAEQLNKSLEEIKQRWLPYAFGSDDSTISQSIGNLLRTKNVTLTTAESCTGGWLGKMIVDTSGSSDYYLGGWVTYSNSMKVKQLRVDQAMLDQHGAVSEQVAKVMAVGALNQTGADYALSITGVAGPNASKDKPKGMVFIALACRGAQKVDCVVKQFSFPGDRRQVRDRSAKSALQMLRFKLMEVDARLLWEV